MTGDVIKTGGGRRRGWQKGDERLWQSNGLRSRCARISQFSSEGKRALTENALEKETMRKSSVKQGNL